MGYSKKVQKRKNRAEEDKGIISAVKSSFIGTGIALVVALLLCLSAAGAAYSGDDPNSLTGAFGLVSLYISAFVAGFAAVKINGSEALICGTFSGCLLSLVLVVISLFFGNEYSTGYSVPLMLVLRMAAVLMALLGAFAALHKSKTGHKRKH